jgi:hypothetical protein
MTRRSHLCGLLLPLAAFAASASAAEIQSFDSAATVKAWGFNNGPEFPGATGSIEWRATYGHTKPGCLALHYSFEKGGSYVQAGRDLPKDMDARAVRLWLFKPGDNEIGFRAVDSTNQTFQKTIGYTASGWQQLEVDLGTWTNSWGGANDNRPHWPMKAFAVLVESSHESREGTVLIDDLEPLPSGAVARQQTVGTYDALHDRDWHAGGGADNEYRDGVWKYHFGSPELRTEFSFLGDPRLLRLVVESDGSGHGVSVHLGSHFQGFTRQIGRLTQNGEMTLEAPLDDMGEWRHGGGEDDGQRRLPLRMINISLDRSDGPVSGTIRVKRLEIETRYAPAESVVLIPSARQEGEVAQFSVTMRNLTAKPVSGKVVCDIRGLGERVERKVEDVQLPGAAVPVMKAFSRPLADMTFAEAVFQMIPDGSAPSAPASMGLSTVPGPSDSPGLQPESIIGAGLYLYRWNGHPQQFENITRMCELAQRAGVKWSREEISWDRTEPREGQFEWSFYDRMLEIAQQHGISVYGLLDYWSPWAAKNTPAGVEQYCRWAKQVVRRYKGRIHHWEIWNEPNIFFWSGPRELYAELLTKAYEAIKAEDPTATVMGCSTAGIDTGFIEKVMKWGGKFDALTIHPYRGTLQEQAYMKELRDVKAFVGGRPVWLTEIGFPSEQRYGWSERNQAALVARTYLSTLASGAAANVSWYDFRNDGDDPFYNEYNFGMVRHDFAPKPAYRALATFGRSLAGMKAVGPLEVGPGAYAFKFADGGHEVIAACAPERGRLLAFETSVPVTIVNGVGEAVTPVEVKAGGGTHAVKCVTLDNGFPVYIRAVAADASGGTLLGFKAVESPIKITTDGDSVRPGSVVKLHLSGAADVSRWELPFGWTEPEKGSNGDYVLQVPATEVADHARIQAFVEVAGRMLRLPIVLNIEPLVIRL